MTDKPNTDITWAESAAGSDVDQPSTSLRNAGYPYQAPLPHDELNYLLRDIGRHIDALNRNSAGFSDPRAAYDFLDNGEYARAGTYDASKPLGRVVATDDASGSGAPADITSDGANVYFVTDTGTLVVYDNDLFQITSSSSGPNYEAVASTGEYLAAASGGSGNDVVLTIWDTLPNVALGTSTTVNLGTYSGQIRLLFCNSTHFFIGMTGEDSVVGVDPTDGSTFTIALGTDGSSNQLTVPADSSQGCASDEHLIIPTYESNAGNVEGYMWSGSSTTWTRETNLGTSRSDANGAAGALYTVSRQYQYSVVWNIDGSGNVVIEAKQAAPFALDSGFTQTISAVESNTSAPDAIPRSLDANGRYGTLVCRSSGASSNGEHVVVWEESNPQSTVFFISDDSQSVENSSEKVWAPGDDILAGALTVDGLFLTIDGSAADYENLKLQLPPPDRCVKGWTASEKILHG